jgi:hypothetical protein
MSNPTSNFNWQMPTATDLVTDLPADFEVFGQAVDTSLADLKGGTTGQVLSKTSGTDMDFTWVDTDDTNAIQNAIVTAKGDLIGASASATPLVLAVGTDGQTLVADSAEATGLKWAAPAAGGKLLQVVSATTTTSTVISSTSYTDTTITATITPTLNTSKIFVMISSSVRSFRQGDGTYADAKLLRDATSLTTWTDRYFMGMDIDTSGTENNLALVGQPSITYMDSPASTSALTYKLQSAVYTTSASSSVTFQISSSRSTITLFEIGA